MGESILVEALHQPVTSLLAVLLVSVFAALHHRRLGYAEVGMSYDRVVDHLELWRCVAAQISHVELLHLAFNLSALWSIGVAERVLGVAFYLKHTSLLFILSPAIAMTLYHAAIRFAGRENYRSVTAVGYSCVLFGWMTVLAVRQPGGITMLPLFGTIGLPMFLTPFGSLLFTSLLIPRASFVGHLAGILAGYVISVPVFDMLPAWAAVGALGIAVAGGAANYVSLHGGLGGAGGELKIPLLGKWMGGGGSSADVESGGAVRGRVLGGSSSSTPPAR